MGQILSASIQKLFEEKLDGDLKSIEATWIVHRFIKIHCPGYLSYELGIQKKGMLSIQLEAILK
jgi:hypothetical protein